MNTLNITHIRSSLFYLVLQHTLINSAVAVSYHHDIPHEIPYEKCDCTNYKFTKHITAPYKEEIEQWFIQTATPEDQSTEADAVCVHCPAESTDEGTIASWWREIKSLYKDTINWLTNKNPEEPKPKDTNRQDSPTPKREKKNFIPSICFQVSGTRVSDKPKTASDFFTCIHEHYDGSNLGLCRDIVKQPGHPKACDSTPIPCEDVQNSDLSCNNKFKSKKDMKTNNGCNRGAAFPRKPCLNAEYLAMTAKAFHDVTKCLDIPQDLAFSILHHESRFILNNKSNTGALCYSQVTSSAVADFNSFLNDKPHYPEMKELLRNNIQERCPSAWKHFQKVKTKKERNRFLLISSLDKCKLNLNPYTCFFYGLSYIKILTNKAQEAVQKINKIEIAKVNGSTWIFKDELEKKKTEDRRKINLETTKIKVFPDETTLIKWLTTIGYNGGLSIPGGVFRGFMQMIKGTLSNPKNKWQREKLVTSGLDISYFKKHFIPYIRRNYPQNSRRKKEVADYMKKVKKDMKILNSIINEKHPALSKDTCPR